MKLTNEMQAFDLLVRTYYRTSSDGKTYQSFLDMLDILLEARSKVRESLSREEQTVAHIIEMLHIVQIGGRRCICGDLEKVPEYSVNVGNIGTVYTGTDAKEAHRLFEMYAEQSRTGYGRAAYECVTVFCDEEIEAEHIMEHPEDCTCRHCEPIPVDAEERYIRED